jgi:hypothetical protein
MASDNTALLKTNRMVLKEWAVVVDALLTGEQLILLRKGGIHEGREGFRLAESQFFLYPTYEHESKDLVREEFHSRFDRVHSNRPETNRLLLPGYGTVEAVTPVGDLETVARLDRFHIWNRAYLEQRLEYKPDRPLYLVLLRAFRLPAPPEIEVLPDYAGCVSWVPLEMDLPVTSPEPALSDAEFGSRKRELETLLEQPFLDRPRTSESSR